MLYSYFLILILSFPSLLFAKPFPLPTLEPDQLQKLLNLKDKKQAEKSAQVNSTRAWSYSTPVLQKLVPFWDTVEAQLETFPPKLGLMTILVVASRNKCFY